MNELQYLRSLINAGKATESQLERYNTLLGQSSNTSTPVPNPQGVSIFGEVDWQSPAPNWVNPPQTQTKGLFGTPISKTENISLPKTGQGSIVENTNPNPAAYTKEEYMRLRNEQGFDMTTAGEVWDKNNAAGTDNTAEPVDYFPLINPGGSDLSTELYSLGRAIGAEKGSQGRVASGIAAGGAALFDIGRNVASGIGFEKRNQAVEDYYRKKQQEVKYTPNSQTRDVNGIGGMYGEDGGTMGPSEDDDNRPRKEKPAFTLFPNKYGEKNWFEQSNVQDPMYEKASWGRSFGDSAEKVKELNERIRLAVQNVEGGSTEEEDMYYSQFAKIKPGAMRVAPAAIKYSFEDGGEMGQEQGQQVMEMAAQVMQQGASPEEAVQALVAEGVPEQQAVQAVQAVMSMQSQQTDAPQDPQLTMKDGGLFDKQPGDKIDLKFKNKTVKGEIKEVKNGTIFLK